MTGEGAHTVRYVAYDMAGNVSALGTANLTIDTTAPGVSDDADPLYDASPANFTITAYGCWRRSHRVQGRLRRHT